MDAKHAKTLSGVFVALLVGAAFASTFVAAQDSDPTSSPDVVFDVDKTKTIDGVDYYVAPKDNTVGKITYNSSWDVTFTNLTGASTDVYTLRAEGATDVFAQQTPSEDGKHDGRWNVTFSAANVGALAPVRGKFDQVGTWELLQNDLAIGQILVNATDNLKVTLSKSEFVFSTKAIGFRITVTDLSTGSPVAGAKVVLTGLSSLEFTTNADGIVDWTGSAPAAGKYTITATKQAGGTASGGDPEFKGDATLTIAGAGITATSINTDVLRGFDGTVEFNFTKKAKLPALLDSDVLDSKINITFPNGTYLVYFGDGSGTFTADADASTVNDDDLAAAVLEVLDTTDGSRGNVRFEDGNTWKNGQYRMVVSINTVADDAGSLVAGDTAEYEATVRWTPGAPADVNLQVTSDLFVNGKLHVQNRADPADAASGLPDASTVTVRVTGSHLQQHPAGKRTDAGACTTSGGTKPCWDAFTTADNVTLSGDYLRIVDDEGGALAPLIGAMNFTTGEFDITNLYPTKGGGKVTVSVKWKNSTWTKDISIGYGGEISADKSEIVVETPTAISFTLKSNGAADPFGQVRLFRVIDNGDGTVSTAAIASTPNALVGSAQEGKGLDGKYTFTLKETELGTYLAYGQVGHELPSGDFRNWTYTIFRVVPAHDLKSEVRSGADILASKDASVVSLNVTKADGATYADGTDTEPIFYFLNATQLGDFQSDGKLPTAVSGADVAPWKVSNRIQTYNVTGRWDRPGAYSVYVRAADGKHDNAQAMPTFTVHAPTVTFSPPAVVGNKDIEANTTVTVTVTDWTGKALNGTLISDYVDTTTAPKDAASKGKGWFYGANVTGSVDAPKIKVENGKATFKVTGFKLGKVWFDFDPNSKSSAAAADTVAQATGEFLIVTPNVLVNPSAIPVGSTSPVQITVLDLAGKPLQNLKVQICGPPVGDGCTGNESTSVAGQALVGVTPFRTGNLTLRVSGNETSTTIRVFAGLVVIPTPDQPKAGDMVVLHVRQPGRTGEPDVKLTVKDASGATVSTATTDVAGNAKWTPTVEGQYTITAEKLGFDTATSQLTVAAQPPPPPPQEAKFGISDLKVTPTKAELGGAVLGTVKVTNSGNAAGETVVRLKVNGVTFGKSDVSLGAGESDDIALSFTPNQAGTYQVTVALPDGTQVGPVSVEVTKPAPPTPPKDDTPKDDPKDDTPSGGGGVPGFEAIFALAALGVAFLLVRRKQK